MSGIAAAITPAFLRDHRLPDPGDSKKSRGVALVVGGSTRSPGAVSLAGLAALRVGAGVLTLAVPSAVAIPLAIAIPEAGVTAWATDVHSATAFDPDILASSLERAAAVVVGPGIDDPQIARRVVECTLNNLEPGSGIVLDAYALGVLSDLRSDLRALPDRCVLTPNRDEAARLLEADAEQLSSLADDEVAARVAKEWSAIVIYQGVIASPSRPALTVATGHGGLGTSGSGDVLAGAVGGVLARGTDAHLAACWAAYLHAAAGDRLASRIGRLGFLARELLLELPLVMSELNT